MSLRDPTTAPRVRVPSRRVSDKPSPRAASELETGTPAKGPVKESRNAGNRGDRPKRSSLMASSNSGAGGRKRQKEPAEGESFDNQNGITRPSNTS